MSTQGVNGQGNFRVSNFWQKPSLQAAKAEQLQTSAPIKMTGSDTVKREELGFINPYNSSDATISSAREIASDTNRIMASLGYENFKVSPKTVVSVSEGVTKYTLPAMNQASDNAVAARISNPDGPFAELFA